MKFKIWDTISYGHLEPLVPFTKLMESNNLDEIKKYIKENKNSALVVTMDDEILFTTFDKINNIFDKKITSNKKK